MAMRKPNHIRPALRDKIDREFLPEIHHTRWAERLAQLVAAKRRATSPAERAVIQTQIRDHYKHENDLNWTRLTLATQRVATAELPPPQLWKRARLYVLEQLNTIRAWQQERHPPSAQAGRPTMRDLWRALRL